MRVPVEVVTAAQRLSVIYTLKGCGGEGARVDRDPRLPVHSREHTPIEFQLGGPSLHIIRPCTERHSSLISLRLAGFPCALSTATAHRSKAAGRYMPVAEAQSYPTEPHTVHLQSCPQVGPTTFLFVLTALLQVHWHWPAGDLINVNDIHYPEVTTRGRTSSSGLGSRITAEWYQS